MPAEAKRDGQALEILGTYDPVRHELIRYYNERVDAWVSQGAKMSNAVRRLKKLYTPQSQEQKHDAA
jgi:ribosomal protein S16